MDILAFLKNTKVIIVMGLLNVFLISAIAYMMHINKVEAEKKRLQNQLLGSGKTTLTKYSDVKEKIEVPKLK